MDEHLLVPLCEVRSAMRSHVDKSQLSEKLPICFIPVFMGSETCLNQDPTNIQPGVLPFPTVFDTRLGRKL